MNNEKGYTLLVALFALVLVCVLGLGLVTTASNTSNTIVHERDDQSTYYLAEAGINLEKAKILTTLKTIFTKNQQAFNEAMTYAEQQAILNTYRSFDNYYNTEIGKQFCTEYTIIHPATNCTTVSPGKYTFKYTYTLSPQFNKNTFAATEVLLDCTSSPCKFTIESEGYFENEQSKARSLNQVIEVQLSPTAISDDSESGGGNNNGGDNNSGTPSSPGGNSTFGSIAVVTKGAVTLEGGAKIFGTVSSIGNVSLADGTAITEDVHTNGSITSSAKIGSNAYAKGPITVNYGASFGGKISTQGNFTKPQHMTLTNQIIAANIPNSGTAISPTMVDTSSLLPAFPVDKFAALKNTSLLSNIQVGNQHNQTDLIKAGVYNGSSWLVNPYTLTIPPTGRLKSLTISSNTTQTFNIGSNTVDLYVDDFNLDNGHLKLQGDGTLNIYVNNSLKLNVGSLNSTGMPAQVNIYYKGTQKLTVSQNFSLHGSIHVQSANMELTGGASIKGNIYNTSGQELLISGGLNTEGTYIIAPETDIRLTGGGVVIGAVIARSIHGSGGAEIHKGSPTVFVPTIPHETNTPIQIPGTGSFIIESGIKENR